MQSKESLIARIIDICAIFGTPSINKNQISVNDKIILHVTGSTIVRKKDGRVITDLSSQGLHTAIKEELSS